jgi:ABC-type sugar transport system ATPase subunit
MIEIKNVKKSFGDKTILHDVSLVMETGKCNLIIGSSGSGKTVLLKCLVGLFTPDEGNIITTAKHDWKFELKKKRIASTNRNAFPGFCIV